MPLFTVKVVYETEEEITVEAETADEATAQVTELKGQIPGYRVESVEVVNE